MTGPMTDRVRFAIALALFSPAAARAQVNQLPEELTGIGIDDKPGAVAPADLMFTDQDGNAVRFGDYFDGRRPVALVLAYYQCPMLCSMVLNGLTDGLKGLARESGEAASWTAGDRFRVVTVSFDRLDTPAMAKAKRDNQIAYYGHPVPKAGWDFLVGDPAVVKQLADAVGFHYRWDERQKEFAHAAGAFVFTPDGRLARTLTGIRFPAQSLRLALMEASEGRLGGTWDRVVLFCFHYDPAARGYVLFARRFMAAGGVVMVILLGFFFAYLFRQSRIQKKTGPAFGTTAERVV